MERFRHLFLRIILLSFIGATCIGLLYGMAHAQPQFGLGKIKVHNPYSDFMEGMDGTALGVAQAADQINQGLGSGQFQPASAYRPGQQVYPNAGMDWASGLFLPAGFSHLSGAGSIDQIARDLAVNHFEPYVAPDFGFYHRRDDKIFNQMKKSTQMREMDFMNWMKPESFWMPAF